MRQPRRRLVLPLKRQAFKRAVTNLVTNAARFGDTVGHPRRRRRRPGCASRSTTTVPAFLQPSATTSSGRSTGIDDARNQDDRQLGLGLAIARDIARRARRRHRPRRQLDGRPEGYHLAYPCRGSEQPAAVGTARSGAISTTSPLRIREAQRQHLRHHLADLTRRKVHNCRDLPSRPGFRAGSAR